MRLITLSILTSLLMACQSNAPETEPGPVVDIPPGSDENVPLQPVEALGYCEDSLTEAGLLAIYNGKYPAGLDGKTVCFQGVILQEYSYGDLYQADVAFAPFENSGDVPFIYCQFTGKDGDRIMELHAGDPVSVRGILNLPDNPEVKPMIVKASPLNN